MYKEHGKEDGDGIVTLIRETADGFGHLLADHIKLARLELVADVKTHGRQIAIIALIVPVVFLGYGLACVGLALVLAEWLGQAGAFFAVGGAHAVAGAIAIAVAAGRLRQANPMHESALEANRSVEALTATRVPNGGPSVGSNSGR
jgi:hypothetical protein